MGNGLQKGPSFSRMQREVRGFRSRDLLPLIAAAASDQTVARLHSPADFLSEGKPLTPWALAGLAREVIVQDHGGLRTIPTMNDIRRLCAMWIELPDPIMFSTAGEELTGFFVRTGFEQFRYQASPIEEVSRTRALYLDAASQVPNAPLLSAEAWETALGCPLDEFVRTGFLLHVWAAKHSGWVDLSWLDGPQFAPVRASIPAERVRAATATHLSCSMAEFRGADAETYTRVGRTNMRHVAEHRYNPLEGRPLVQLDSRLIAPQPMLLLDRVSSTGIYYDRCTEDGFTKQLGFVFEHYVGLQLKLIPGATVISEREYKKGCKTVDWVVVLEEVVLLVEAKATRLTEQSRMGLLASIDNDLNRTILKAHTQIETTARLIRDRHTAVADVPADRPMLGVVVTLEPYWLLGTGLTPVPEPANPRVGLLMASSRDIEQLAACALTRPVGPLLRDLHDTGATGTRPLTTTLDKFDLDVNPLIKAAWDQSLSFAPAKGGKLAS